jgi:hypothetical protein
MILCGLSENNFEMSNFIKEKINILSILKILNVNAYIVDIESMRELLLPKHISNIIFIFENHVIGVHIQIHNQTCIYFSKSQPEPPPLIKRLIQRICPEYVIKVCTIPICDGEIDKHEWIWIIWFMLFVNKDDANENDVTRLLSLIEHMPLFVNTITTFNCIQNHDLCGKNANHEQLQVISKKYIKNLAEIIKDDKYFISSIILDIINKHAHVSCYKKQIKMSVDMFQTHLNKVYNNLDYAWTPKKTTFSMHVSMIKQLQMSLLYHYEYSSMLLSRIKSSLIDTNNFDSEYDICFTECFEYVNNRKQIVENVTKDTLHEITYCSLLKL